MYNDVIHILLKQRFDNIDLNTRIGIAVQNGNFDIRIFGPCKFFKSKGEVMAPFIRKCRADKPDFDFIAFSTDGSDTGTEQHDGCEQQNYDILLRHISSNFIIPLNSGLITD